MRIISMLFGLVAIPFMFIGIIPFLGWSNWIFIPIDSIGLLAGLISMRSRGRTNLPALIGVTGCGIAMIVGIIRLWLGFFIL
jgi:hypothetical protein